LEHIERQIEQLKILYDKELIPEKIYEQRLDQLLGKLVPVEEIKSVQSSPNNSKESEKSKWDYDGSSEAIGTYPAIGTILRNRYQLESKAGQGGMGVVYKALDKEASEAEEKKVFCAIKVLSPLLQNDPQALNALKREAGRSKQLSHNNIVNVYDFDSDGQWTWIQMEWLDGFSLAKSLATKQETETCFTEQEVLGLLPALSSALSYAHGRKIIHRDIKPANIFQCSDGRIVLLDFGIARILSNTLSRMSKQKAQASGTFEYMPPEAFHFG